MHPKKLLWFSLPKTIFLSDLLKKSFLKTQFSSEFQFSMPVSCLLDNSPNDSNYPIEFSSVLHRAPRTQTKNMSLNFIEKSIKISTLVKQNKNGNESIPESE